MFQVFQGLSFMHKHGEYFLKSFLFVGNTCIALTCCGFTHFFISARYNCIFPFITEAFVKLHFFQGIFIET